MDFFADISPLQVAVIPPWTAEFENHLINNSEPVQLCKSMPNNEYLYYNHAVFYAKILISAENWPILLLN